MESSDTSQNRLQSEPLLDSGEGAKSLPVIDSTPAVRKTLPIPHRLRLGWGKIRRFYLVHFRPRYVQASLERRRGDCHRTGACCNLMFKCPLLKNSKSSSVCSIYERRPLSCRTFPIDERDLADRDLLMPDHPCGFSFRSVTSPPQPRRS